VTAIHDRLPSRREDVLVADFDTELVVLVPGERRAHRLDAGLSLVLSSCDGETTYAELADEVSAGTGESGESTQEWLDHALATLRDLGVFGQDSGSDESSRVGDLPTNRVR
jgi:hypothetical protein